MVVVNEKPNVLLPAICGCVSYHRLHKSRPHPNSRRGIGTNIAADVGRFTQTNCGSTLRSDLNSTVAD